MGERERSGKDVLAIRERRVIQSLQERRVRGVRAAGEEYANSARIAKEARQ